MFDLIANNELFIKIYIWAPHKRIEIRHIWMEKTNKI